MQPTIAIEGSMTEGEIGLNAGAADDAPVVRFTAQLPAPRRPPGHRRLCVRHLIGVSALRTARRTPYAQQHQASVLDWLHQRITGPLQAVLG